MSIPRSVNDDTMHDEPETRGEPVGRVCPYGAQQCTLAAGCPTINLRRDVLTQPDIEHAAYSCNHRGAPLWAREIWNGVFYRKREDVRMRERHHARQVNMAKRAAARLQSTMTALASAKYTPPENGLPME